MVQIAIVDDVEADRACLSGYITRFFKKRGEHATVFSFADAETFLRQYPKNLDILLLDIQMKGTDGVSAARQVRTFDTQVLIIFTTNLAQYVLKGYEVDAMDFLIKPIREPLFNKRMEKALARLRHRQAHLIEIQSRKETLFLDINRITYCESYNKKVLIHIGSQTVWCSESLEALEAKLSKWHFYSCHRSFLINLNYVETIQALTVIVAGTEIPVSKYRKKGFLQELANYMGETLL